MFLSCLNIVILAGTYFSRLQTELCIGYAYPTSLLTLLTEIRRYTRNVISVYLPILHYDARYPTRQQLFIVHTSAALVRVNNNTKTTTLQTDC